MYETLKQAVSAKEELHRSNLYKNCCALRVEFCMKEKVDVMVGWDFSREPRPRL